MTCQVVVELKIKPDAVEQFRSYARDVLPDTRSFEGCVSMLVVRSQDDPSLFMLLEQWDSRADYEKYLQWRTETGLFAKFAELVEAEPSIKILDYFGV